MSNSSIFVQTINTQLAAKLTKDLTDQGFEFAKPPYTIFSAKKPGVVCTLYESGKITVQGKQKDEFIEFYLEPNILGTFSYTHSETLLDTAARIGIDESGKGDFFGPLCIAGIFAEDAGIPRLKALGVKDSKLFTDSALLKVAKAIRSEFIHHVVKINPAKYNELYEQFKNLNRLLAWGHATTIEQLVDRTNCKSVIIDQFASEHIVITALKRKKLEVSLTQRHRAEEDLVVAAASILAREAFLMGLKELSERFGINLPKGASSSTIKAGKDFIRAHGYEALPHVAKLHFKTTQQLT